MKKVYNGTKLNLQGKAIHVQVCIGGGGRGTVVWHRTGAYCTAKLTFSHDFRIKVWSAYYTSVHIIFKFLVCHQTVVIYSCIAVTSFNVLYLCVMQ